MMPKRTAKTAARPRVHLRAAAQRPAARISALVLTITLLAAGCTPAPEASSPEASSPQPAAAGDPGRGKGFADSGPTGTATPQPSQPPLAEQARPLPAPATAIPVRPATPQAAQVPRDAAPRFLTVEGTTINMPIVEVGVSPDGAMEIPEPFNEAGWYRFGPSPGAAAGTAVLAAHVDTTSDSAPFSQLKSLAPGTVVTVQREGAGPVTFRVTGVELMAKDAFDGASIFRRAGPPELKLVTCGGRWLDEQQDYGDNVIVTAVPA